MGQASPMHDAARAGLLIMAAVIAQSSPAVDRLAAHGGPVRGLALSADGRWMASTSFDYSAVLWSMEDLAEVRRLNGHEAAVNAAAFSPDGRFLVTAGDDNTLRVWRMEELVADATASDPVPRVVRGHTAKIVHLAFSPDGSTLASSSWDRGVGLWSVPDFNNLGYLRAHASPVNAAVFSVDSLQLYSAGADGHVRLWDVETQRYLRSIVENGWGINVLALDGAGGRLAYGTSNGQLRIITLDGNGDRRDLLPEGPPVLALAVDPASGRLACGNADGRMLITAPALGEVVRDFHAAKGPVWAALLTLQGGAVLFAGLDDFFTHLPLDADPSSIAIADERRFHPSNPLDNGARQFARKCSVCHSLDPSDHRRAGPTLLGVFGRRAGGVAGYPYSPALASADIVWSEQTIDALFKDGPDVVTPGSKMPLQRIGNAADRRDLIEFLKARTTAP